jgi:hypothetical protein
MPQNQETQAKKKKNCRLAFYANWSPCHLMGMIAYLTKNFALQKPDNIQQKYQVITISVIDVFIECSEYDDLVTYQHP